MGTCMSSNIPNIDSDPILNKYTDTIHSSRKKEKKNITSDWDKINLYIEIAKMDIFVSYTSRYLLNFFTQYPSQISDQIGPSKKKCKCISFSTFFNH